MNELQTKLFEMLKVFTTTCDKLGLTYYMAAGTALGCVRHNGFIPWDDDLDIIMPRPDYEKLIHTPNAFSGKYFLQTYETDPCYVLNWAKLRDSSTTYVESNFALVRQNHGVWIDISPLDGFCTKKTPIKKLQRKIGWNWHHSYMMRIYMYRRKIHARSFIKDILLNIYAYLFFWTNVGHWRNKMLDKRAKKVPYENAYQVGFIFGKYAQHEVLDANIFKGEPVIKEFEGWPVKLPPKIDEYLTSLYGDYMTPPPANKRGPEHMPAGCDLSIGYEEYQKKHRR